jgi:glycosyltransferase involved in cell wall biosynthesis
VRTSAVIPTYHRPDDLRKCIASMLEQTVRPDEIIVVDDGDLDEVPLVRECREAGMRVVYVDKDRPGLAESRNIGAERSTGDIVFYFDDDVVLEPDYFQRMLEVYRADPGHEVGGVGGAVINTKPLTAARKLRWAYDYLFGISGTCEGRLLRSGFCTDLDTTPFPPRGIVEVDFLSGGVCSYRREVLERFRFTPGFREVARGEDKEFSLHVSRHYRLLQHPGARLYHYPSPSMRPDRRAWGRKMVVGHYLLFRRHAMRCPVDWLWFYYAAFGYVLSRVGVLALSLRRGALEHLRGSLEALRDALAGRIALPDTPEIAEFPEAGPQATGPGSAPDHD